MKLRITRHNQLEVYKLAFSEAMRLFEITKGFPKEERYSLIDQLRRSSRSICANLAEAWRKRQYEAAFVSKLSDCLAEASETQTWLEFAVHCKYLDLEEGREIYRNYDQIISKLVRMANNPQVWLLPKHH